jgi:hypothetical protein
VTNADIAGELVETDAATARLSACEVSEDVSGNGLEVGRIHERASLFPHQYRR